MDKIYNQKDHRVLCSVVEERRELSLEEANVSLTDEAAVKEIVKGGKNEAVVIGLCIVDTGNSGLIL